MHTAGLRKKRPIKLLVLSILTSVPLLVLVMFFPPTTTLSLTSIGVPIVFFFFLLLFLALFSLSAYLLKSKKHALLIGAFTVIYLLFRFNDLTHWFFLVLLIALFLILELLFTHKRTENNV